MTKTRHRRPRQYEKYRAGCMWGILSMLDFRGRSNQRLLSDKKSELMNNARDSGNRFEVLSTLDENIQTTRNGKGGSTVKALNSKPGVKKLIEEEFVGVQDPKIKKGDAKSAPKNSEKAIKDESNKNRKKNRRLSKGSYDFELDKLNISEGLPDVEGHDDLHNPKIIVEQICGEICQKGILGGQKDGHPDSVDSRTFDIKEKLGEAIREFINQQLTSGKHLGEDGTILFSEELVNVLQVPNLDEESFLKHMHDPNYILMNYMQSLQEINLDRDGISELRQEHDKSNENEALSRSFERDVDSQDKRGSKRREKSSSRIIILKPGLAEGKLSSADSLDLSAHQITQSNQKHKANAPFSVASIKRKLKNVMGREQSGVSPGGLIKKYPNHWGSYQANVGDNSGRSSPGKEHFYLEKMAKPSPGHKREDKFIKSGELGCHIQRENMNDSKRREANIYLEAKKHLIEMLSTTDEMKKFSGRQFPKSLGRILSLPDYNSPLASTQTDIGHNLVTAQMRFTSQNSPEQVAGESAASQKEEDHDTQIGGLSTLSLNESEEVSDTCQESPIVEGEGDIPETTDDLEKEFCDADVEITISYDSQTDFQNESFAIGCDECQTEEHCCGDRLSSTPSTSPQSSSTIKKEEDFITVIDRLERPSPISVLDPSVMEDDISPAKASPRADLSVELRIQPLQIKFDDEVPSPLHDSQPKPDFEDYSVVKEYVSMVLQAAGLKWSKHYLRSEHSDQLIDPSLFDRVDFSLDQLQCDQKLLFDCINEVLFERPSLAFADISKLKALPETNLSTPVQRLSDEEDSRATGERDISNSIEISSFKGGGAS
ncbi:hypothetical protein MLD38_039013 [Melastoma candidum]|uniref:Uncharacterized protein n=1 Tax=Melastoma candidum TaxID=119954 RepID=A0ACB9L103_9MYRT|nr:hypothetical protein MLD38_039013 [Melastoma candidum]